MVYHSLTPFKRPEFKVSWDSWQPLHCNPCKIKIKKQFPYFWPNMAQNMHFHSEREKIEQSEEILGQSKMDDQQVQLQTPHLHAWWKVLFRAPNLSALLTATDFCPPCWFSTCQQLSLVGRPWLCHLCNLGVWSEIRASPSQLHTVAFLSLHAGTCLTRAWPQRLYLAPNGFHTPFLYPWL